MIILHAGIDKGQFLVWGEVPGDPPPSKPARKAASDPSPQPYPFDAGPIQLVVALAEVLPGKSIPGGGGDPPVIWLPTSRGRPIPSSGLVADVPAIGEISLAPWTITALPLPVTHLVDLLCACQGRDTLGQGLLIGTTLAYWTRVFRFAGALLAREQIVPGLRRVNGHYRAIWQHVIAGPDGGRLARLVRSMPHACRAISRAGAPMPDRPPAELVHDFLARTVDGLVHLALHGPIVPGARGGRVQVLNFTTVHDHWLHALSLSQDGIVHADEKELQTLTEQVRAWQRPISVSSETAFGLCFRLEEPPAEAPAGAPWRVRYLLQARDDPSLYIPVAEAWKERSRATALFQARGFEPREYLLTALGQAASFSPHIERSLKTATPGGFQLDATGAYNFLNQTCWMLEQAGFSVLLPNWWTKKGGRHTLNVRAEISSPALQGNAQLSLNELVSFDWQVALGEEKLSLQELQQLAKLKAPLVKVRGQWVQVRAEDVQAAIRLLERRITGQATLREVVQMALGGGEGPGGLPFGGVKASGWVADFLAQLEGQASFAELPPPDGFQGTLRPYQIRGYSWLSFLRQWGLGACLADDMGLGKTIQTLALLEREWQIRPRPCLLICPTSVVANWKKEAERFTPNLPVMIHHGGRRARNAAFTKEVERHALVLTSYSLLHRDRELFEQVKWAGVILDEAQNVKNPQTKQSQAARALPAEYRIALTGTPVENHVGDLWAILEFLNPGWLGTLNDFRKRFFIPIQAQQDVDAAMRLRRLTAPFILRRLKTDKTIIADLPEKLEMKVFCTLTREQATLYQSVVDELNQALESTDGIQRKGVILATLTRLKQVCNHPAHFLGDGSDIPGRSGKLARLTEMLEEVIEAGEHALVFTQFTEMGNLLKRHLQETFGKEVLFLHGGVPREQRVRLVDRFQTEPDGPRVFLLSLKAGGTGLNLTRGSHVFHFDRWWNPAVENQATDRAFRIGQTRNVQVHKFVCAGTVEERIDEMIEKKQAVAARVVAVKEDWLTELSNDQLRDLFQLRHDAIGE
ncbi:MAG: DEAD/DEAH box helicase [Gemmataceae bacterium]